MGIIGGQIGYLILRAISPKNLPSNRIDVNESGAGLGKLFGEEFFGLIQGKTVIDFGCGAGNEAVEMAIKGAGKVIGIDIREKYLSIARGLANKNSVADRCMFTASADELADIIISKDCFEHFSDPAAVLRLMSKLLKPGGFILVSFGWPWFHPYGGHLFSVFPWAHLIFTENALIRWRSNFKSDGASKFSEVDGGLNIMTIRRFEQFVENSPLRFEYIKTIPIKGIRLFQHRIFREIGSSIVQCKLILRNT
ncbi:MAG: class I SAM-dependent methyltransferase [Candidatus Omnitrophica bacterium]|nr:class I SAM-dependent methyltransferase [Candidatus Omnitrophota bacterium]